MSLTTTAYTHLARLAVQSKIGMSPTISAPARTDTVRKPAVLLPLPPAETRTLPAIHRASPLARAVRLSAPLWGGGFALGAGHLLLGAEPMGAGTVGLIAGGGALAATGFAHLPALFRWAKAAYAHGVNELKFQGYASYLASYSIRPKQRESTISAEDTQKLLDMDIDPEEFEELAAYAIEEEGEVSAPEKPTIEIPASIRNAADGIRQLGMTARAVDLLIAVLRQSLNPEKILATTQMLALFGENGTSHLERLMLELMTESTQTARLGYVWRALLLTRAASVPQILISYQKTTAEIERLIKLDDNPEYFRDADLSAFEAGLILNAGGNVTLAHVDLSDLNAMNLTARGREYARRQFEEAFTAQPHLKNESDVYREYQAAAILVHLNDVASLPLVTNHLETYLPSYTGEATVETLRRTSKTVVPLFMEFLYAHDANAFVQLLLKKSDPQIRQSLEDSAEFAASMQQVAPRVAEAIHATWAKNHALLGEEVIAAFHSEREAAG